MSHQITAVQDKNSDWKVISILNALGEIVPNVSVNRTSKKGDVFPNFDNIKVGATVEGRLWQSDAGKTYLFALKGNSNAPKADSGPAANNPAAAEIKNMLTLKILPLLEKIDKQNSALWGRLGVLMNASGIKTEEGYPKMTAQNNASTFDEPKEEITQEDTPW